MTVQRAARAPRDRGSFGIAAAAVVTVSLGGAALVVDGGRAMAARRFAANTAEAAARAGAATVDPYRGLDAATATDAARSHAERSGVASADVIVDVTTDHAGRPEVVVTVTARRPTVMLVLAGADVLTVRATGSAVPRYSP